jgi:hypothetical protein
MNINLENTYWDRYDGFVSELRVDARWTLRDSDTDKALGSLRIGSFPDLQTGYLRAIFVVVTSIREKNIREQLQSFEDFRMTEDELELYSVDNDTKTETITHEAPFKELEKLFNVKIFKK